MVNFLREYAGRKFQYGETDCALFLADWLAVCGYNQDPAEGIRGTYVDEYGCHRYLRENGGLLRIVARKARELRLERVDPASAPAGSVGVIRYAGTHFGAIRTHSGRWAIKCNDGIFCSNRHKVVAAWRVA